MTITPERPDSLDERSVASSACRPEFDDYPTSLEALGDWHLLGALEIHRPDLTAAYARLIDQEPFDED